MSSAGKISPANKVVHRVGPVRDDPNIVPIGSDALGRGKAGERPLTLGIAVAIVEIDRAIGVDYPELGAVWRGGDPPRAVVAGGQITCVDQNFVA